MWLKPLTEDEVETAFHRAIPLMENSPLAMAVEDSIHDLSFARFVEKMDTVHFIAGIKSTYNIIYLLKIIKLCMLYHTLS